MTHCPGPCIIYVTVYIFFVFQYTSAHLSLYIYTYICIFTYIYIHVTTDPPNLRMTQFFIFIACVGIPTSFFSGVP